MKKIIIAVFIVIATLGIATGTTAKKATVKTTTTKKSTSTPKKEVTDPYLGWWFSPYNEAIALEGDNNQDDMLLYVSKENGNYNITQYQDFPKTKGAKLCKNWDGLKTEVGKEIVQNMPKYNKRATKEQVERLKYNITNAVWLSKEKCDSIN